MDQFNVLIGGRVQKLRKQRGYSQEELGERIGMTRSYICYLEKGRFPFKPKMLQGLAVALNIDRSELIKDTPVTAVDSEIDWEEIVRNTYRQGFRDGLAQAVGAIKDLEGFVDGD